MGSKAQAARNVWTGFPRARKCSGRDLNKENMAKYFEDDRSFFNAVDEPDSHENASDGWPIANLSCCTRFDCYFISLTRSLPSRPLVSRYIHEHLGYESIRASIQVFILNHMIP